MQPRHLRKFSCFKKIIFHTYMYFIKKTTLSEEYNSLCYDIVFLFSLFYRGRWWKVENINLQALGDVAGGKENLTIDHNELEDK